jgi:hypothetical protein
MWRVSGNVVGDAVMQGCKDARRQDFYVKYFGGNDTTFCMDKIRQVLNEFRSWRWEVRGPKVAEGGGLRSARQGRGLSAVAMQGSRSTWEKCRTFRQ